MEKYTESGKRYIQLTNHLLMEYIYVADRYTSNVQSTNIEDDLLGYDEDSGFVGTYGDVLSQPMYMLYNAYLNECYYFNGGVSLGNTNNGLNSTVLPISKNTNKWVECVQNDNGEYYSHYDKKWEQDPTTKEPRLVNGEWDVRIDTFEPMEQYVAYDVVRVYFQSGYVPEYEGFVFNIYTRNKDNKYVNLLSQLFGNKGEYKMSQPMWFADKLYTNYIEWRVPSVSQLASSDTTESIALSGWGNPYNPSSPENEESLPYYMAYGRGFNGSPSIGIDVYGVANSEVKHGFRVYNTTQIVSTLIPNHDTNERIVACVWEDSEEGDFLSVCPYYKLYLSEENDDPFSLYKYLSQFGATFTFIHTLDVTERYSSRDAENNVLVYTQSPLTYIQTWEELEQMYNSEEDESPVIKFRPVIEHASDMIGDGCGASVTYTLRITNNRDHTTMIRNATYNIDNPRKYGKKLVNINLGSVNNINVYNRIQEKDNVTLHNITMPISQDKDKSGVIQMKNYVTTSLIDRRNIKVSIRPVKISDVENVSEE